MTDLIVHTQDAGAALTKRQSLTLARLKINNTGTAGTISDLTEAESRLADLVNLSEDARSALRKSRKLDSYLRVFGAISRILNGTATISPAFSTVEVEYFQPEKESKKRINAVV